MEEKCIGAGPLSRVKHTAKELEDRAIKDIVNEDLKQFKQSNINLCINCGWPLSGTNGCECCIDKEL